ncbi:MAG TPA: hypothetical protein VH165_26520 [Kofleriaceae bacterium]|jgi:hypothetical protein|nr:hypothetical protein [Kofleriaceae bacterium]
MPQVVELPPIGQDARGALVALVRVCKEMPGKGEPFRELRSRLRAAKLWDRDRPAVILRFLGTGGATAMPSLFMQALAAANGDDETAVAVLDRVWHLNPLLGKTVLELVAQRAYHKDEIYKHLASAAYRGVVPSRPALETWLQIAIGTGLLRTLGIAVTTGPRVERYAALGTGLDVDEFLAEDRPDPEPVIPQAVEDEAAPAEAAAPEAAGAATVAAPASSPLPAPLRHLTIEGVPCPRNRDRVVPTSRFVQGFPDELLDETRQRIAGWWSEAQRPSPTYQPSDFGIDAEAWVEGADEVVYRVAVAAALAFRLDRDRAAVIASFRALDKAGVLGDLYQGTVPENLPAQVDARALMLASLAARRCAEVPELASQLDGRATAAEAFASLDAALGRGLFRTELFWIMDMLAKLGVIRYADLGDFTVTPYRIVRDTLFRLGFIGSPYASDGPALTAATRATRRAVPDGPADEILATFALACGCAYDCTHRKTCDYPCRERLE